MKASSSMLLMSAGIALALGLILELTSEPVTKEDLVALLIISVGVTWVGRKVLEGLQRRRTKDSGGWRWPPMP